MIMRWLLAAVAVLLAVNGANMLFAPESWYHSLPSVPLTGPFNPHFVMDIGCAYLASALGVGAAAWRPRWTVPALLAPLVFLGLHALVHVLEAILGHASAAAAGAIEVLGVYGPPLLLVVVLALAARRAPSPAL